MDFLETDQSMAKIKAMRLSISIDIQTNEIKQTIVDDIEFKIQK